MLTKPSFKASRQFCSQVLTIYYDYNFCDHPTQISLAVVDLAQRFTELINLNNFFIILNISKSLQKNKQPKAKAVIQFKSPRNVRGWR